MFLIHFRPIFPKEVYKNIMAVKVRSADSKENVIYKRIKVKKKKKKLSPCIRVVSSGTVCLQNYSVIGVSTK